MSSVEEREQLTPTVKQWKDGDDAGIDTDESADDDLIFEEVEDTQEIEPQNGVSMQLGQEDYYDDEEDEDVEEMDRVEAAKDSIEANIDELSKRKEAESSDLDEEERVGTSEIQKSQEIQAKAKRLRRAVAARDGVLKARRTNSKWRGDRLDVLDRKNWLKEVRRFVVEFYGTWTLTLVACMVAIQYEINPRTTPVLPSFAIGFTLTILIYSVSPISGAHFNPIVSWAFLLRGMFPIQRVLIYWIAQFSGALIAAGMVYAVYTDTNNLGSNIPGDYVSNAEAYYFESLFTFIFVTTILSVSSRAKSIGPNAAMAIGIALSVAHFALISTTGTGLNPARSLGPACWVRGRALHVLWIYVAGPFTGSTAAVIFAYFISLKGAGRQGRLIAMGAGGVESENESARDLAKNILNKTTLNLTGLVRAKPHSPRIDQPVIKETQDIQMGEIKTFASPKTSKSQQDVQIGEVKTFGAPS